MRKHQGFATILVFLLVVLVALIIGAYYLGKAGFPRVSGPGTAGTDRMRSSDGSFTVTEEALADYQVITIKDNRGNVVVDDLIARNHEAIGYNVKFRCQCGTYFKAWVDNTHFTIQIVNGGDEEYEYLVDAKTGRVDESTFKRIK